MLVGVIAFAAYYESNIAYDYLKKMSVAIEVYESIILEYENAAEVDELKMNELKGQLAEIDPRTAVYKASMGFSSTLGLLAVLFAVITWFRRSEKTYQKNIIASKKRWLRRQPAARLSALNLGVRRQWRTNKPSNTPTWALTVRITT